MNISIPELSLVLLVGPSGSGPQAAHHAGRGQQVRWPARWERQVLTNQISAISEKAEPLLIDILVIAVDTVIVDAKSWVEVHRARKAASFCLARLE